MQTLLKTCQVLNSVGISMPEDPQEFFRAANNTNWADKRINWQDTSAVHEGAREALRMLVWMTTIEAFNGTLENTPAKSPLFEEQNLRGIWNLMTRLSTDASQANTQEGKELLLVSYNPEKKTVSESKHYGLLTHQIQEFSRIVQLVHPHNAVSEEIGDLSTELLHNLNIQKSQEMTQLNERSREVSESNAFYGEDHADLLEQVFAASETPGEERENKDEAFGNFGKVRLTTQEEPGIRRKFSRERKTLPNFADLGHLPEKTVDLPANMDFIRAKGEALLNLLEEKDLGIPDRGAASASSRNDLGSTLVKIHRKIVNNSPDLKLEELDPEDEHYNALIKEQVAFGIRLTCDEFGVDYEEFRKQWQDLQETEMAKNGGETMTYEDAVWAIAFSMKKKGILPEEFNCGQFSASFTSKGGACVERSSAMNHKKQTTVQMLDEVTRFLHTDKSPAALDKVTGIILDLFKAEKSPGGSGRSIRREFISELERIQEKEELRTPTTAENRGTPAKEELTLAQKTLRQLGTLQLHGEPEDGKGATWDTIREAIETSLKALAALPSNSGSPEKGTKYVRGSEIPLFPPGQTLLNTIGFLRKNVEGFDTIGESRLDNIYQKTSKVIQDLKNPGFYAEKAATLPAAEIKKSLERAKAGIALLDRLSVDKGSSLGKMAKFAMEAACSPTGAPEEQQFWKGLTSLLSFSKTNAEAKTYPIPRHYQKAVAIMARDGKPMEERVARKLVLNVILPVNNWIQDKDPAHNPQRYLPSLARMEQALINTLATDPKTARASIKKAEVTERLLREHVPTEVMKTLREELIRIDPAKKEKDPSPDKGKKEEPTL